MESHPVHLNDIALFIEVARRKSFSLAARALAMPTSTLSRRISQLEQSIGLRLINRNTRRLELTEAGAAYLRRCQGLVDEARLAHEQLQALSVNPQGRLRVAIPYSIAIWLLPEALKAFTERYPDLECEFDLSMTTGGTSQGGDPFDLRLCFSRPEAIAESGASNGLIIREITSLESHLYASAGYLHEHEAPQKPADLSSHECFRTAIDPEHSYWTLYNDGRAERVAINGALAGNSISVMGALAGLGLGITRLPNCRALAPMMASLELQRVLPAWHLESLLVYAELPSPAIPAKTRVFMEFLRPWLDPVS